MAIDSFEEDTIAIVIQVTSTGLAAKQPLKINSSKLLQELLQESHLSQKDLQTVLQFIIDGNLPVEHAQQLIDKGADVNHSYPGMQNLLHLAWKHVKEDKNMWDLLFNKSASLDGKAQTHYSDVDPEFLKYYKSLAPAATAANLETKSKYLK
jgi:hypothetical protein